MARLISKCRICEENRETRFFLVDRATIRKPLDDERIEHLRTHKGHEEDIRLKNYFETTPFRLSLTEEEFNELGKLMKREGWLR